jgi:hypothetical protein
MKSYITAFYNIIGIEGEVAIEVPSVGNGKADYLNLDRALLKRFPKLKPGQFKRASSKLALKDGTEDTIIDPTPGMTLRQLFPDQGDGLSEEAFRNIGTVFFKGGNYNVTLRYLRSKAAVGVSLTPFVGGGPVRFTNQIQAGILVDELPRILREIFGNDGRDLKLRMRVAPKPVNQTTHKPGEVIAAKVPRSSLKG